jgi:hypothetical protein
MSRFAVIAVVAALGVGVGVAAQQEMLPRPGPGSGITPVSQRGNWEVAINNTPTVRIANAIDVKGPAFLKNGRHDIIWANGDKESVTFTGVFDAARDPRDGDRANRPETSQDLWVEVVNDGGKRWINLASARSVERR